MQGFIQTQLRISDFIQSQLKMQGSRKQGFIQAQLRLQNFTQAQLHGCIKRYGCHIIYYFGALKPTKTRERALFLLSFCAKSQLQAWFNTLGGKLFTYEKFITVIGSKIAIACGQLI